MAIKMTFGSKDVPLTPRVLESFIKFLFWLSW